MIGAAIDFEPPLFGEVLSGNRSILWQSANWFPDMVWIGKDGSSTSSKFEAEMSQFKNISFLKMTPETQKL